MRVQTSHVLEAMCAQGDMEHSHKGVGFRV